MGDLFVEGDRYLIIYDDKGIRLMKKEGIFLGKDGNLIKFKTDKGEEFLNSLNIIRGIKMEGGSNGGNATRG